jgi:hypothetical protein
MTEEDLYSVLLIPDGDAPILLAYIEQQLDEFFESNVCIPKGENRHPDADAIHQLAERTLTVEIKSNEPDGTWGIEGINDFLYRIKPSDPIYEYLYEMWIPSKNALPTMHINGPYCTDDEASNSMLKQYGWSKNEKSKRERK